MRLVRNAGSALVLIVALLGASAAPALAALHRQFCASEQHACCKGPKLIDPCCGRGEASQSDSTPGHARVELRNDLAPVPAILGALPDASTLYVPASRLESRPHSPPLDRPTLFSALLI